MAAPKLSKRFAGRFDLELVAVSRSVSLERQARTLRYRKEVGPYTCITSKGVGKLSAIVDQTYYCALPVLLLSLSTP